jgi:hypothetical protein
MAYDLTKDVFTNTTSSPSGFGALARTGADAAKSDTVDLNPYAKSIILLTAGTLKILPAGNDDAKPIAWTESLPAGWICPYRVRRVFATGTAATFATIDG